MQIWCPEPSFESVRLLNNRHLAAQTHVSIPWVLDDLHQNYKCYGIWKNHKGSLLELAYICVDELNKRGKDVVEIWAYFNSKQYDGNEKPDLIGNHLFHAGMRSQLLKKDYEYYKFCRWREKPGEYPLIHEDPHPIMSNSFKYVKVK